MRKSHGEKHHQEQRDLEPVEAEVPDVSGNQRQREEKVPMRKELVIQLTLSKGMRRNILAAIPARTSAGIADAASGVTQWASTVYRLFSSLRRGSREKRSGRPWPKHDAMPGTLFALVRAFVDSTNPHRGGLRSPQLLRQSLVYRQIEAANPCYLARIRWLS